MPEHHEEDSSPFRRSEERQFLLDELERQSDSGEMKVDYLAQLYERQYPGEAVWTLVHDIERQAFIWYNVAELIKNGGTDRLKEDFEDEFRSFPRGTLTNPIWGLDLDKAFEKMKNYCKGLFQISHNYAQQLMAEMNVQPGTTAIVQVDLGLPPSLTVGFEKSFGAAAVAGATASRT